LVDESGNILVYPPNSLKGRFVFLDKDGNLLKTFSTHRISRELGFSDGIVFSEDDGSIIFKLPQSDSEVKQKVFFKDVDKTRDGKICEKEGAAPGFYSKPNINIPAYVGEYKYERPYSIDRKGNVYVMYMKVGKHYGDKLTGYWETNCEIGKFSSSYKLLAIIPVEEGFVNLENEKIYELNADYINGIAKMYRWGKIN